MKIIYFLLFQLILYINGCKWDLIEVGPPSQAENVWTCGDIFIDGRDNQEYETRQIGSQCWMMQNLNFASLNSLCYNGDPSMCDDGYGRLYPAGEIGRDIQNGNGFKLCPLGWKVATDAEWLVLEEYLGMPIEDLYRGIFESPSMQRGGSLDVSDLIINELNMKVNGCHWPNVNAVVCLSKPYCGRDTLAFYWTTTFVKNTNTGLDGWVRRGIKRGISSCRGVERQFVPETQARNTSYCVRCILEL